MFYISKRHWCLTFIGDYVFHCLFLGLPDPFAKISVDGSGQVHSTNAVKGTLDPKWNTHYDLYLSKGDGITIRLVLDIDKSQ